MSDGNYSLTVTVIDKAGNTKTSDVLNIQIDTVGAPRTHIDLEADSDSGKYNYDNYTNINTPTFTVDKNVTLELRKSGNSSVIQTINATSSNSFTLDTLSDGDYILSSGDENNNSDIAGNTLNYSYLNFTIDTTPTTPTIELRYDSGISDSDRIINDSTPSLNYTKEQNSDLVIKDNGTIVPFTYSYYWNSYITLSTLSDGNHTLTATSTDLAGNIATSTQLEIQIDTVGIEAATISVEVDSDKGYDSYRQLTNDNTPTIVLDKNQSIRVLDGITVVQEHNLTLRDDGKYAVTLSQLTDSKTYKIETGQSGTDVAGNSLGYSYINLSIDTSITIATLTLDSSSDTGISNSDLITNDNTPRLKIKGESYASYVLYRIENNETNTSINTGSLNYYGNKYIDIEELEDGNYTYFVTVTDTAGNSMTSSPLTIQIDTVGEDKYSLDINNSSYGNQNLENIPNGYTLNYNDLYSGYWSDAGADMYDGGNKLEIDDTIQYIWTKENSSGTKTWGSYQFDTYTSSTSLTINNFNASKLRLYGGTGADGSGSYEHGVLKGGDIKIYYHQIHSAGDPSINHIIITNSSNPTFTSTGDDDLYSITLDNIDNGSFVQYILIAGANGYHYSKEELLNIIPFRYTNDSTPTVIVDKNATLTIKDKNTTIQTITTIQNDSNYIATLNELSDGLYTVETGNRGTDTAGNALSYSSIQFIVDTHITKPTIDLNSSSDSGYSNSDNITNINTPTIIGTGEPGSKIVVSDESNVTLGTTTVNSDGNYSVVLSTLADGNYTIKATSTDAATNSDISDTLTIQIDTFGDTTISLDLDTQSDSGTNTSDNITNDTTPTINTDRFSTIWVKNSSGNLVQELNTTNNSVTLSALSDGNYTIYGGIDGNDTAGNFLSYGSMTIQIDTTAPIFTSPSSLDKNSTITSESLHVYNTATSDASSVRYTLSGADSAKFIIDSATGILTLSNIDDAGQTYSNLIVTATDIAGNTNTFNISVTPQIITPLETAKILANDGANYNNFGKSVAISGDYIVVGTSNHGVYIYKKQANGSVKELTKLSGLYSNYVSSVDIDGDYIVIGANSSNKAYLYKIVDDSNITKLSEVVTADYRLYYGYDVAIDGDYIVVSNYGYDNAYLFKINSDDNITQISKITTTDSTSNFGYSLDISGDYIIVGDYYQDSAYLFKRNSDANITQVDKITQNSSGIYFGYDVAIDNKNIVIGVGDCYYSYGKAYVYQIDNKDKMNQIAILTAKDSSHDYYFGYSVAIDGEYIAIGDYYSYSSNYNSQGAIHLFKLDNEDGVTEMKKITASDAQYNDYFGYSVAIDNGNIVSGAIYEDQKGNNAGAVYLYDIFANKPYIPSIKTNISHQESNAKFTYTIPDALSIDNATLTYSLSGDDSEDFVLNNGIIQSETVFDYETPIDSNNDNNYSITLTITDTNNRTNSYNIVISVKDKVYLQSAKAKATDAQSYDYFGNAIASDGNYTVIGAYKEDANSEYNSGSAYLFKKNSDGTMTQLAKINAADASSGDYFGSSVDIDGDYIIIGAPNEDTTSTDSGASYLFKKDGNSVSQIAKLKASDLGESDNFGQSVSISGDYIVIGSPYDDDNGTNSGSIYIFKINSDTNVTQIAKLSGNNTNYYDNFGYSVAIDGDYIVSGAYGANKAYLFKRYSDDNISQISEVTTTSYRSYYGKDVSISEDYIVIGDEGRDRAYLFKRYSDDNITELAILKDSTSKFGYSVDIDGNNIIIGDYINNSATLFKINSDTNITKTKRFTGSQDFGKSVSVSGDDVYIGAPYEDTTASDSGAVYLNIKDSNQP